MEDKGKCFTCRYYDGAYCCGGVSENDLTIEEISILNEEAEENGLITHWQKGKCDCWEADLDDSFEDVAFDNWRERYEE